MYCHCTVYTFTAAGTAWEGEHFRPSKHSTFISIAASEAKSDRQEQ
jgi:hypothetical protein